MAILRSMVRSLAESHIPVISSVIPSFMKQLPRPAHMVFNLFAEDYKGSIIAAKRRSEKNL